MSDEIEVDIRLMFGGDRVTLEITDRTSLVRFFNMHLTHEQYGTMLSGHGLGQISLDATERMKYPTAVVGGLENIGKKREQHSETFKTDYDDREDTEAHAYGQSEVDSGQWQSYSISRQNQGRTVVRLLRWVEPAPVLE